MQRKQTTFLSRPHLHHTQLPSSNSLSLFDGQEPQTKRTTPRHARTNTRANRSLKGKKINLVGVNWTRIDVNELARPGSPMAGIASFPPSDLSPLFTICFVPCTSRRSKHDL